MNHQMEQLLSFGLKTQGFCLTLSGHILSLVNSEVQKNPVLNKPGLVMGSTFASSSGGLVEQWGVRLIEIYGFLFTLLNNIISLLGAFDKGYVLIGRFSIVRITGIGGLPCS